VKRDAGIDELLVEDVEQVGATVLQRCVARAEYARVAADLGYERRFEQRLSLVHEPALHIGTTGDEGDIVVTEDDAGDIGDDLLAVFYGFRVKLDLLGSTDLLHDDDVLVTLGFEPSFHGHL